MSKYMHQLNGELIPVILMSFLHSVPVHVLDCNL